MQLSIITTVGLHSEIEGTKSQKYQIQSNVTLTKPFLISTGMLHLHIKAQYITCRKVQASAMCFYFIGLHVQKMKTFSFIINFVLGLGSLSMSALFQQHILTDPHIQLQYATCLLPWDSEQFDHCS